MMYLFILCAYLIGSIPFGLLLGKLQGIDLREHGSKNIGATNAFRILGKNGGTIVFLLDASKGYLAVAFPVLLSSTGLSPLNHLACGIAVILGHTFPVWLAFRGGKGVATALGVFLAISPIAAMAVLVVWILSLFIFRLISLSSIIAAACFPGFIFLTNRQADGFVWLFTMSLLLFVFILFTHRANIGRIFRKEEKKIF